MQSIGVLTHEGINGVYTANYTNDSGDEHIIFKDGRDFYKIRNSGSGVTAHWCTNIESPDRRTYDSISDELILNQNGTLTYERYYGKDSVNANSANNTVSFGVKIIKKTSHTGKWSRNGNTIEMKVDE
jgi:hypothetical protein